MCCICWGYRDDSPFFQQTTSKIGDVRVQVSGHDLYSLALSVA